MGGIKPSSLPSASLHGVKFAGFSAPARPLARNLTPKEFAGALNDAGIPTHEKTIRRRCRLPQGDPLRIETKPSFPRRFYIPATELERLLSVEVSR